MQAIVKGMVQVAGTTYRIVRVTRGVYSVIRILDDTRIGGFTCGETVDIEVEADDPDLIREVARTAIQGAKTSWVGRSLLG